jgi:hypothetical protein
MVGPETTVESGSDPAHRAARAKPGGHAPYVPA